MFFFLSLAIILIDVLRIRVAYLLKHVHVGSCDRLSFHLWHYPQLSNRVSSQSPSSSIQSKKSPFCSSRYLDQEENVVMEWKAVAMSYAKSWFVLDVVSSIPFEIIDLLGSSSVSAFSVRTKSCDYKYVQYITCSMSLQFSSHNPNYNPS